MKLRDTAEQIASTQDLTTPIPADGEGEVGSLARSFTTMVDALATSRAQQQRLITDASHEMRTPLTSLRTNIEVLGRADQMPEAQRAEVVDALQLEVGELSELVAELVELATDSSKAEAPEPVVLADLATDVATRAIRRWGREVTVTTDGDPESILGQPAQLERAISNLVDNAIKYSPPGSPVEIAVTRTDVVVRDRGPGIAPEDQPHVFDRFYRSTMARTEPGSGLGLAIVEQIVQRHHGRVWATNRPDGGAEVGFSLRGLGRRRRNAPPGARSTDCRRTSRSRSTQSGERRRIPSGDGPPDADARGDRRGRRGRRRAHRRVGRAHTHRALRHAVGDHRRRRLREVRELPVHRVVQGPRGAQQAA